MTQECIPVGCVPPAVVAVHGGCLSQCLGYTTPPGVGLETPQVWAWNIPLVWAWRPPGCGPGDPPRCGPEDPLTPSCGPGDLPLGVGLETPPGQTPQLPPWVWAWRPPLETCKACWDTTPL